MVENDLDRKIAANAGAGYAGIEVWSKQNWIKSIPMDPRVKNEIYQTKQIEKEMQNENPKQKLDTIWATEKEYEWLMQDIRDPCSAQLSGRSLARSIKPSHTFI